ncbi:MAG TPA: hypothetical protein VKV40_24055 [Ktedonobacteraceae bacterium]|nr:hypothetical protein [Ktedonobacteraceae bacterium]
MAICEYCGADIPEHASFCGQCGQAPSPVNSPNSLTRNSFPPLSAPANDPFATVISPSQSDFSPVASAGQPVSNPSLPQYRGQGKPAFQGHAEAGQGNPSFPASQEQMPAATSQEEEEERRRRAALLGLGFVGGLVGDARPGSVPMVQGTPQVSGVPSVSGAPQMGQLAGTAGHPFAPGTPGNAGYSLPVGTSSPQHPAPPAHPTNPNPNPAQPKPPTKPTPNPPAGCAPAWLIIVSAIVLIITSIITTAFTVLSPTLSLSGSGSVSAGGTLHLYGSHFLPGSSIALTLDGSTPLYVSSPHLQTASSATMGEVWILVAQGESLATGSNVVRAAADGSFAVTIPVGTSWKPGQHTIRATENISQRSAALSFTVVTAGTTPTPSPTATVTATATTTVTSTPSPSPSPSPSITPTATATGLSCINPATLALGPVSEGYNQATSSVVTLCTEGSGVVNWIASWDQNAAPWLQLDRTSGQIQAPGQQQVTVSANASGLKAGNYAATVAFNDQQGNTSETLTVNFTVQTGCVSAMPTTLSFTGEAGVSDPSAQTVSVTNCSSLPATWSASVTTSGSSNWLSVNPSSGTLKGKAAQNVTVTASNVEAKLSAGTYTGQITFAIGSTQSVVNVTLTVQAAPTLVVEAPSPPTFDANADCGYNASSGYWTCTASIANSSTSLSLNWTSSSSGIAGIIFKPASGTLGPNQGTRVQIIVPSNNCSAQATLTFSGPANSDNVSWYCTIIS